MSSSASQSAAEANGGSIAFEPDGSSNTVWIVGAAVVLAGLIWWFNRKK